MTGGASWPRIHAVVAAAGAGKTYRICEDIAAEIERVDPERIVATTFTVKAAAELLERARERLFQAGKTDKAARLRGARVGTINSICGGIVAECALDLGRSPNVDVIPEEAVGRLFAVAASGVIEVRADELNPLAEAFGMFDPAYGGAAPHWRRHVLQLVEMGRANALDPEGLRRSGTRSRETFRALLPEPAEDGETLDSALLSAARDAARMVPAELSQTAQGNHVPLLRRVASMTDLGSLSWPDWVRLTKVKAAKKDGPEFNQALEVVRAAASRHADHPRLREHCERYIDGLFACAAEALQTYDAYKAERGLVDFVDQETLALEALRHPEAAARLSEGIERVFIDEFQDSSPLQVAIFTRLAELARDSTWVGDPKQAIYGFRNADSTLTQTTFAGVLAASEEPVDRLATSRRSRQGIIEFVNAAFAPALDAMGLPSADHAFDGTARREPAGARPPLNVWRVAGNADQQSAAIATAVRDALAAPDEWMVERKGCHRPLAPGDIGVLCRTNDTVRRMAEALGQLGVPVAAERGALANTPQIQLVLAACRWVVDRQDRLSLAELARFFAETPDDDAWLAAAAADGPIVALGELMPVRPELEAIRQRQRTMTPGELVDAVVTLPSVLELCGRWGNIATRREDLEALRGFARRYEVECASAGRPATLAGLILAVAEQGPQSPATVGGEAVEVLTYHRAKGLEWPLVVLTGLATQPRPRLFDQPVAEMEGQPDWHDPLGGRWLRFWPWPCGQQRQGAPLMTAATASEPGQVAERRAAEEETRLLYVGVTRARDHLVLAYPAGGRGSWLDVLAVQGDSPHVVLPKAPGEPTQVGGGTFEAAFAEPCPATEATPPLPPAVWLAPSRAGYARAPLDLRPSEGEAGTGSFRIVEEIELGPRLALGGAADMTAVGEAVHAALAAEATPLAQEARLRRAEEILVRWGVRAIPPEKVLCAVDRLERYVADAWRPETVGREVPVRARHGEDRLLSGQVDMLVTGQNGFRVVDHKSFPGDRKACMRRALGHGGQLALYADAVSMATGVPCVGLYIHLPLVGLLVGLARADGQT